MSRLIFGHYTSSLRIVNSEAASYCPLYVDHVSPGRGIFFRKIYTMERTKTEAQTLLAV